MPNNIFECDICGGPAKLMTSVRPIRIGARVVEVEDDFVHCEQCGQEFYLPGQMDLVQCRAADKIREEENLLKPAEIRDFRKRLQLSQAAFEKLLGVGAKTVVRWEKGSVFQNKATDSLIRLLASNWANVQLLARLHGVQLPAQEMVLELEEVSSVQYHDAVRTRATRRDAARFWNGGRPHLIRVDAEDLDTSATGAAAA